MAPSSSHLHSESPQGSAARRKIRKGTFSCWECKHRKRRCEFRPASSSICLFCQRRGLLCARQEFTDTRATDRSYNQVEDRLIHVENLVDRLLEQNGVRHPQPHHTQSLAPPTQLPFTAEIPSIDLSNIIEPQLSLRSTEQQLVYKHNSLSIYLRSALPNPAIAKMMLLHSKFSRSPFQMLRKPGTKPTLSNTSADQITQISALPSPGAHPVTIAHKLIQLAISLCQIEDTGPEELLRHLNGPMCDVAKQYLDVAHHVTSQDMLVQSLDGLETLILESAYHVNIGNLKLSWLTIHRALGIAQLMGFPSLAETAGQRAEFVWFRLVYSDHFLSVMLGLPHTGLESSFANKHSLEAEIPSTKLERIGVTFLGRVIQRNLKMKSFFYKGDSFENTYDHYKETYDIDHGLKQAARRLPVTWWVVPSMQNVVTDTEAMETFSSVLSQMHHYYVLVLLHQPYLLKRIHLEAKIGTTGAICYPVEYTYSKLAIISASREVLSRSLMFLKFDSMPTFHGLVEKIFTASTTLLLTHLDGHRMAQANVHEHQRPQDLAVIDQIIEALEKISTSNRYAELSSSIRVLRELVEIEEDVANGVLYSVRIEDHDVGSGSDIVTKETRRTKWTTPYFGEIQISLIAAKEPQLGDEHSNFVEVYTNCGDVTRDNLLNVNPSLLSGYTRDYSQSELGIPSRATEEVFELQPSIYPSIEDLS
ncbi:hypothetical protein F5884DRAFT_819111 [Xylogone sp. PMI_703]|nr:hypothetical protein F5884DRAFT_819111 [Xylogone sp. PMI_703]